ncbi:hypothetical protein ACXGQW_04135 [Wenyingzhuangia sp. IMCC45533]
MKTVYTPYKTLGFMAILLALTSCVTQKDFTYYDGIYKNPKNEPNSVFSEQMLKYYVENPQNVVGLGTKNDNYSISTPNKNPNPAITSQQGNNVTNIYVDSNYPNNNWNDPFFNNGWGWNNRWAVGTGLGVGYLGWNRWGNPYGFNNFYYGNAFGFGQPFYGGYNFYNPVIVQANGRFNNRRTSRVQYSNTKSASNNRQYNQNTTSSSNSKNSSVRNYSNSNASSNNRSSTQYYQNKRSSNTSRYTSPSSSASSNNRSYNSRSSSSNNRSYSGGSTGRTYRRGRR